MVEDIAIIEGIRTESGCLWELLIEYLHTDQINRRRALKCSRRLAIFLKEYERRGLSVLPECEIWFANQVLTTYSELQPRIYA